VNVVAYVFVRLLPMHLDFEGNIHKNPKHYPITPNSCGKALQDYNLVSIFKKQVNCCKKMFEETKKLET
jgi:hypothetical protein